MANVVFLNRYQMKHTLMLFLGLLMAVSGYGQTAKNAKAVIQTTIFCDHCKQCETCGKNFQDKLLAIKGVRMYELDEKKMTLTVYYNSQKTNLENIKKVISDLGYDADDVKANPIAYENLDGCCKKPD
ncbi:heavy-metal-associated domain-containing protein [Flavobacterium silvaticum]|uniref:Copper chaperone n=1 Tax=Flavobacterium silvaticum TaxID=1852020 RepID=A0A972JHT8_9FLAO|nr:cation transporter [Flavobacterium silvaticum]NMH26592.1 copper chaperone [Flavobacterium silvaticum]